MPHTTSTAPTSTTPAKAAKAAKAIKPAAKTVKKPAQKAAPAKTPSARPQAAAAAGRGTKPAAPESAKAAAAKPKKNKLVRDSYTIPKSEYQVLDELKQRLTRLMRPAKKSELLRAGIKLLDSLSDDALLRALAAVPALKTGRPEKNA